jgi:acetoin utilization deacetylase AcuC-like enzyme
MSPYSEVRPATMADVLRVHEYTYVHKIQKICERIPDWNTSPTGALGRD